jgi:hypothetical protein
MLVGELIASPMMAQDVAEVPSSIGQLDEHPEVEVSYSAAPEPTSVVWVPAFMIVKPVPAVSADVSWSASNPTSMMSVLEVVTEVAGVVPEPVFTLGEVTAKGVTVSILVTAKTMISAPVTVPENVAEKEAEPVAPLAVWP